MPPDDKAEMLKAEYLKLQDIIETYDERVLQIKGWSVTASLAGMAAALIAGGLSDTQRSLALLVAAAAALGFWIIEAIWKAYQYAFYPRIEAIEEMFREEESGNCSPFQIKSSWHKGFKAELRDMWKSAISPAVMLPHAIIVVAGGLFALKYS